MTIPESTHLGQLISCLTLLKMKILNDKNLDESPAPVITNLFDAALDEFEAKRKVAWVEELKVKRIETRAR